jgi:hypothetical protein
VAHTPSKQNSFPKSKTVDSEEENHLMSEKRAEVSRTNGSRSAGPKSAKGKTISGSTPSRASSLPNNW